MSDLYAANRKSENLQKQIDTQEPMRLAMNLERSVAKANRLEREFLHVLDLYERAVGKRAEVDRRSSFAYKMLLSLTPSNMSIRYLQVASCSY